MKTYQILLLTLIFISQNLFSQVGINTDTPQATLDVVAQPTLLSNDKVLEVKNTSNTSLLNVKNNGDMEVLNALMPNGDAGEAGDILISQGPNVPPVWRKSIVENATIQIFSAQRDATSSTLVGTNQARTLDFPVINSTPAAEIGTWNSTTNRFTINKKGIFHISTGLDAVGLSSSTRNLALYIETPGFYQTASGINYPSGGSYNYSTNTTLSIILNPGDYIYIQATSGNSSWYQGPSFLSILYSEIP